MWDRRANPDPTETQVLSRHPRFSYVVISLPCCLRTAVHWFSLIDVLYENHIGLFNAPVLAGALNAIITSAAAPPARH